MVSFKRLKVHVRRTQWAVGHGGFHSGIVQTEDGGSQITWIYDCGTSSSSKPLTEEFNLFQDRLTYHNHEAKLDFLFLSHFHEDHVGGLGRIVRRKVQISHIFAPLLGPLERLIALGASDDPTDPDDLDFYLTLIADPARALSDLADTVTFVIPGSENVTQGDIPEDTPEPTEDEFSLSSETPALSSASASANTTDATTTISTDGGRTIWVLEPYVLKELDSEATLQAFRLELSSRLKMEPHVLDGKLSSSEEILHLIKSPSTRSKFRQAYESLLKNSELPADLNLTSLCLYAGPANGTHRTWRSRWPIHDVAPENTRDWADRHEVGAWTLRGGWLHTGDASLQHTGRRQDFLAFYTRRLPHVGAFLLPHHGADASFDAELLRAMGSDPLCIAAAKPGHGAKGWNHPGHSVMGSVSANGSHLLVVSDQPKSRYSDTLTIEF